MLSDKSTCPRLITDRFLDIAQKDPQRFLVEDDVYGAFTYGQIAEKVERLAHALVAQDIGRGDVAILQLPNWTPFMVFYLALTRIGAVTAMLPITYRSQELTKAANLTNARALIIPVQFRGENFVSIAATVRDATAHTLQLFFVRGDTTSEVSGEATYEEMLGTSWDDHSKSVLPDAPGVHETTALGFTSGTTGALKAAIFDSVVLDATNEGLRSRYKLTENDRILGCSPVGHAVGFTHALRMALYIGGSISLMEHWNVDRALALINQRKCTFAAGATPFLIDIVRSPALPDYGNLPSLRLFLCGGATIPRSLMNDARRVLPHTFTSPLWGMTECGGVTTVPFDAPLEKLYETDGLPCDGMMLKIVDEQGTVKATGEEGELYASGPMVTKGYFGQPELTREYFLEDGFFQTGDLARMDEDGYIRITGRAKDLIVRGGVNISPTEIEDVLFSHPLIQSVAVVGYPDPRLGERICAFIIPSPQGAPSLRELQSWLESIGLAKQKWPERLEIIDQLPLTTSRKVQKFKLREMLL